MKRILDSSVIIKGLIEPRRKKQDHILEEQLRIYDIASSIMDTINRGEITLLIPNVAIVEVAAVASRLTGKKNTGIETANFIKGIAKVINENDILAECIGIAAATKVSGFDSIFITCAKATNSTLITDDKKMHDAAVKLGVKAKLLRDMV